MEFSFNEGGGEGYGLCRGNSDVAVFLIFWI